MKKETENPQLNIPVRSVLIIKEMKKGMVFDLYQDSKETRRVMAINERDVMCLDGCMGEVIKDIDFENEVGDILIMDVLSFEP